MSRESLVGHGCTWDAIQPCYRSHAQIDRALIRNDIEKARLERRIATLICKRGRVAHVCPEAPANAPPCAHRLGCILGYTGPPERGRL